MPGKIVINGAGISGLLCALLLCRKGEGPDVIVVDKNEEPGGLLRRFQYDEWGDFDYGMHNLLETGIDDLDRLLRSLLPEEEWQVLEGDKRDLAGVYFNGRLQRHTPYIDLRSLPPDEYRACLADLVVHLDQRISAGDDTQTTAYEYAVNRFGPLSAQNTILPSLEKVHKKSARELDYMATLLTPMSRLAFCDEALARQLTLSPVLRDCIAWPEQRTLPHERSSGRKAIYPVRYGMYRLVDAIVRRIQEAGAQLYARADVMAVEKGDGRVAAVTIRRNGREERVENVARLIWATSIPPLGRHLGVDCADVKPDPPLKTIVVNMVVDRPPRAMGDLYYFFCYDPRFHTFRLTNFANYCRGAGRNGGFPVSMELLMTEETAANSDLEAIAIEEYGRFGFSDSTVLFAKAERLDSGFPMPTVNNVHGLRAIRNRIRAMNLGNVQLVGILAEDNLFFQTDVLADAYRKLTACEQRLPLGKLPFYWRMSAEPNVPRNPVPDFVDFEFSFLPDHQLLIQTRDAKTLGYLDTVYREQYNVGYLQEGHALAGSYGGDFLACIERALSAYHPNAKRISEVGAGGGWLLKKLKAKGYDVAAIDPSPIAAAKGKEFGIEVIPVFYPAPDGVPKSDLILHYDVLEHVPDPARFIRRHAGDLNPGGLIVFAVPDCSPYIASGDVSMLLHEHLNYFDEESLRHVVEAGGCEVLEIRKGGYGSVLYCVATVSQAPRSQNVRNGAAKFDGFASRVRELRRRVDEFITEALLPGNTLGCYVPLRALPYLSMRGLTSGIRFFDDNPGIHGQFFDGFKAPVEGMDELASEPVSHLLIMSAAFGGAIRSRINDRLPGHGIKVLTLADLAPSDSERE